MEWDEAQIFPAEVAGKPGKLGGAGLLNYRAAWMLDHGQLSEIQRLVIARQLLKS